MILEPVKIDMKNLQIRTVTMLHHASISTDGNWDLLTDNVFKVLIHWLYVIFSMYT